MMHPEEEHPDDDAAAAAAAGSRMMMMRHGDVDDRRYENDDIMSLDDVVTLPPMYRRIFVAGTVAFVLLVLLAASTLSQTIPYELVNNGNVNSNTNNKGSPAVYNANQQQQRDEMEQGGTLSSSSNTTSSSSNNNMTFAESMVNLVQQSADQLAQTLHEYEQNNSSQGGGDGGGSPSKAPAPVPAAPTASTTSTSSPTSAPPPPTSAPAAAAAPVAASSPTTPPDANGITVGSINGIAYYGCRASSNVEKTILLFHGASFSKEQWKSSGILDSMCSQSTLTVYAFDMSVSSTGEDLKALMDAMVSARLLLSLPVNAIVTPSASGSMVVDWGLKTVSNSTSSTSTLPAMANYWKLWVPVASPAVAYVDPKSLLSSMFPNIQILAVHGDQDTSGGRVMELLGTYAGAKVVTITGGHACYMQSPTDFVQAVLSEVQ